jgi:hypothetical protein
MVREHPSVIEKLRLDQLSERVQLDAERSVWLIGFLPAPTKVSGQGSQFFQEPIPWPGLPERNSIILREIPPITSKAAPVHLSFRA